MNTRTLSNPEECAFLEIALGDMGVKFSVELYSEPLDKVLPSEDDLADPVITDERSEGQYVQFVVFKVEGDSSKNFFQNGYDAAEIISILRRGTPEERATPIQYESLYKVEVHF